MEIVGGLVRLSEEKKYLPLPWHVRAFLGLQTNANAHVKVTRPPPNGQPPDIIVSPVNLRRYEYCRVFNIDHPEKRGSFSEVLDKLRDYPLLNIAIADTVTTEDRARHRVNLVVEPRQDILSDGQKKELEEAFDALSEQLMNEYEDAVIELSHLPPISDSLAAFSYKVKEGFIEDDRWFTVAKEFCEDNGVKGYDLEKVVISGNTHGRFIRYIFPREGAFQTTISHSDIPGALHGLAVAIKDAGLNILSSRLSRTPPGSVNDLSNYVAVVEPTNKPDGANPIEILSDEVKKFNNRDSHLHVDVPKFTFGQEASKTRFLPPPRSRTIFMPEIFHERASRAIKSVEERDGNSSLPFVFLCYKFFNRKPSPTAKFLEILREEIQNAWCEYLEADTNHTEDTTYGYIHSRLWLSDACLVFAYSENEDGEESGALSPSQTHEIGFMQGQNKPFKIVVRDDLLNSAKFGNVPDHAFITYSDTKTATNPNSDDYIGTKIRSWLFDQVSRRS